MVLKEIELSADRPLSASDGVVEDMSRVVCSLLIKGCRGKLVTPNFWKVSIGINRSDTSEDGKIIGGVLIVCRGFPTLDFVSWAKPARQQFMLTFVASTLSEVLRSQAMEDSIVANAARYVEEHNFVQLFVGKREFRGPAGWSAKIECEQEMDVARIFVSLKARDGRRHRVPVAESKPDEFIIQSFFGKVVWNEVPELEKVDGARVRIAIRPEEL